MTHRPDQNFASCPILPIRNRISKEILPNVQDQLRKRPKHGMSNEDKWYAIWDLLFPGEEHPSSPCRTSYDSLRSCGANLSADSDLHEAESVQDFLAQRMHGHFSANLSTSLDRMGLTQEFKILLIAIAVEQEKVSREELLDMFQKKDSPSPGPVSEEGESPDPAITLPTARRSSSEAEQHSHAFYPQPEMGNVSSPGCPGPSDYSQQLGQFYNSNNERPRPSTPAQFSSSSRSGDSAYHSGSGGFPSGMSDDGLYVNPKHLHLLTPTPNIPHTRRNTAPSRGMNAETRSHTMNYNQEPKVPARQPVPSSLPSPVGNLDTSMYDAFSNDDAPGSPEFMY
jgi:hypothetical protein